MRKFFNNYKSFIYESFIKNDDLDYVKEVYKPMYITLHFFNNFYIIIFSIIFFPFLVSIMLLKNYFIKKLKNTLN